MTLVLFGAGHTGADAEAAGGAAADAAGAARRRGCWHDGRRGV